MTRTEKAIRQMETWAKDDSHGYDQRYRWGEKGDFDWITGGILLPGVFGKSPKSPNGTLESRAGWKGLCRKGMTLLCVLIAAQLDRLLNVGYVRDAVCIGFIANEMLSIIENAGLMGIPLPEILIKSVDILKTSDENKKR